MLAAAAGCLVAFAVLMLLAYEVAAARWLDIAALEGFVALDREPLSGAARAVAAVFDPGPFALLTVVLLAVALRIRGPRHTAAAGLLLVGATASSQVLKPLLAHPRDVSGWGSLFQISDSAYPSGHATASMAFALAAVLVAPRAYRPAVAAIGGGVALAVSMALMILNWHFPSDVVGGQLLATAWCLAAMAALRVAAERWPERGAMRRAAREAFVLPSQARALAAAGAAVIAVAAAALAQADQILRYAERHTAAVAVGAAVVCSAAVLLSAVTALAVRRA